MKTKKILLLGLTSLCLASVAAVAICGRGTLNFSNVLATQNKTITLNNGSVIQQDEQGYYIPEATGNVDPTKNHSRIELIIAQNEYATLQLGNSDGVLFTSTNPPSNSDINDSICGIAICLNNITSFSMEFEFSGEGSSIAWYVGNMESPDPVGNGLINDQSVTHDGANGLSNCTYLQILAINFNHYGTETCNFTIKSLTVCWTC